MDKLSFERSDPSPEQLAGLQARARTLLDLLKSDACEARKPLFIEFAGTPKSGKSSIIAILCHFLRRVGFDVVQPPEGASLRTPAALRDDWLAFNAWSVSYALRHILELSHERQPPEIVVLDRGLFDGTAWMEFLESQGRLSETDREVIGSFLVLDLWRSRELCVFLFSADHSTSMIRESDSKLIEAPGSVMNAAVLSDLNGAYSRAAERFGAKFRTWSVDTSFRDGTGPSFRTIAFAVATKVLELMHELLDQKLLVTEPAPFEGFEDSPQRTEPVIDRILNQGQPRFVERSQAERDLKFVQVVPYALLTDPKGRYFLARRRADHPRRELRGKYTMLVGGHAEMKDWNAKDPAGVFERCLRRELDEELIGLEVRGLDRIGMISDNRSKLGSHHLAVLFVVGVGGAPKVRRQASDQEFGRESVGWKTGEEIVELIQDLDPWSQLVAAKKFGASLPTLEDEPTLFTRSHP